MKNNIENKKFSKQNYVAYENNYSPPENLQIHLKQFKKKKEFCFIA